MEKLREAPEEMDMDREDGSSWVSRYAGGGAGNNGGSGSLNGSLNTRYSAQNGTGGLLILYANSIKNQKIIHSNGAKGGDARGGGGGSGGGSINIFYKTNIETGTITAEGGTGGEDIFSEKSDAIGGSGGDGTVNLTKIE